VPLGPVVAGQPLPDAKALLVAQPDGEMSVALEDEKVCRPPPGSFITYGPRPHAQAK
jgi:hypothetical protein